MNPNKTVPKIIIGGNETEFKAYYTSAHTIVVTIYSLSTIPILIQKFLQKFDQKDIRDEYLFLTYFANNPSNPATLPHEIEHARRGTLHNKGQVAFHGAIETTDAIYTKTGKALRFNECINYCYQHCLVDKDMDFMKRWLS